MTKRHFDQGCVMFAERVDDPYTLDRLATLKIFADQKANTGTSRGRPKHSVPKCQSVHADSPDRVGKISGRAVLDKA
jgi:hypothetical protein